MKITNDLLYAKCKSELDTFIKGMVISPPENIIEKAYEITTKNDIMAIMEEIELPDNQAKALLALKNPLDLIYRKWLDTDYSNMDGLREIIDDFAKDTLKNFKAKAQER